MYQPTGPLGPTQPPDLGLCAESEVRGPGGAHHIRSCHGRRSRDLGAAVGGRGRYGVHLGPVMSVDGGRACAGHPDVLGLAASTGWRGLIYMYVAWAVLGRFAPFFRRASEVRRPCVPSMPLGSRSKTTGFGCFCCFCCSGLRTTASKNNRSNQKQPRTTAKTTETTGKQPAQRRKQPKQQPCCF